MPKVSPPAEDEHKERKTPRKRKPKVLFEVGVVCVLLFFVLVTRTNLVLV